ncbi:MAG: hypothetical protein AAB458_00275 [Patescibacteria group bacterium]
MPPDNLPTAPEQPTTNSVDVHEHLFMMRFVPRIIGGLFILVSFFVGALLIQKQEVLAPTQATEIETTNVRDVFAGLTLEAQAAIVWDAKEKQALFGREQSRVLPLASVSKVVTALAARAVIVEDAIITISPNALGTLGESGLTQGERWLRDDLITFMLVTSSNDAAIALAEHYDTHREVGSVDFVWHMNDIARDTENTDVVFVNPSGLDEGEEIPMNRGSAESVARLFAYALQTIPDLIDTTRFKEGSITSLDRTHTIQNTNTIIDDIPLAIGSKTGFTDSAGGNLVLSYDATIGHPVVIVVLGSSREGRFTDMKALIEKTTDYFALH